MVDEVFVYQIQEGKVIRNFLPNVSIRERTDTLEIKGKYLIDVNGFTFKKAKPRQKKRLNEKYIQPTRDSGFYLKFLEKVDSEKESL